MVREKDRSTYHVGEVSPSHSYNDNREWKFRSSHDTINSPAHVRYDSILHGGMIVERDIKIIVNYTL